MHFHLRGGGGGDGIDRMDLHARRTGSVIHARPAGHQLRRGDNDNFAAGRAVDFGASPGAIDGQLLFALRTIKNDIHNAGLSFAVSIGSIRGWPQKPMKKSAHYQAITSHRPLGSLVSFFELLHPRPDRGGGGRPLLDLGEDASCFRRVLPSYGHAVIQFNPGLARVLDALAVGLEPVLQPGRALLLRGPQRILELVRHARQLLPDHHRRRVLLLFGLLLVTDLIPVEKYLPADVEHYDDNERCNYFSHDSSIRSIRAPSCRSLPSMFS